MVATAWSTARRRASETWALDWVALPFAIAVGASILTLGLLVMNGKAAPQAGVPIGMYFFMGSVPLLAAVGDVRMLVRGGISGKPRLIRHLWRMCFGLFIATGSFFLGQQQVFAEPIRRQYLLAPFASLPFPLMILWLLRVLFAEAMDRWLLSTEPGTRPCVISSCNRQQATSYYNIRTFHSSTPVDERCGEPREHGDRTDGIRTGPAHL